MLRSRKICKKERETRSAVRHGANVVIAKQNFWQLNAYAVRSWVKRKKMIEKVNIGKYLFYDCCFYLIY